MRELAEPAATPIDKLRLELDEIFLPGATVAAFEGRKMLAGIGRITKASLSHLSAEQPHFDALPEKYARLPSFRPLHSVGFAEYIAGDERPFAGIAGHEACTLYQFALRDLC